MGGGRCKKKLSNRANGEVRGLHTSFGASEKKKAAEETRGGKYLPLPEMSQAYYAPNLLANCARVCMYESTFSRGSRGRYSIVDTRSNSNVWGTTYKYKVGIVPYKRTNSILLFSVCTAHAALNLRPPRRVKTEWFDE